ncbi:MAG: hypothetical protein KGZ58_02475 [Ignavibacteriales bacterium]|nr:hypothetical protein [Ignavibacteriales bacterium]
MNKIIFLFCFLFFPTMGKSQNYDISLPSSSFFESWSVFGTKQEQHSSLRMQALGNDFRGFIDDQITDLYRNPAYFSLAQQPILFGEILKERTYSYLYRSKLSFDSEFPDVIPTLDKSRKITPSLLETEEIAPSYQTYSTTGVRIGYANKFGILVRGDFADNSSKNIEKNKGYIYNETFSENHSLYETKSKNVWGTAQFSYGFTLRNNLFVGASYTFGRNERPYTSVQQRMESRSSRDVYSLGTLDSTYSIDDYFSNSKRMTTAHTIRSGLLWKQNSISWDAVATFEFTKATGFSDYSNSDYYNNTYISSSTFTSFTKNEDVQLRNSKYDIGLSNVRLDLRYSDATNLSSLFTTQIGGSVSFFSSTDSYNSDSKDYYFYQSSTDTSSRDKIETETFTAPPDGFAYRLNAGASWNFTVNNFLLVIASTANFSQKQYDYVVNYAYIDSELRTYSSPDTSYLSKDFQLTKKIKTEHTVSTFRFAIPLALETELFNGFHLRTGWVVSLSQNTRKIESNEKFSEFSNTWLSYSTVSFGIGYKLFDNFRADFLSKGNLTEIRDWNISAIYAF